MQIPSFLKKDGESLLFNVQDSQLIYYIPEEYFDRGVAITNGEYIDLIGIFDYTIQDKNGKNNGLHTFNFPSLFTCRPGEIEKIKDVKLTGYTDVQSYRLLKFNKGDQVIVSVHVPQSVENAEKFFSMFLYGKVPNTIPYSELQNYFIENINLNGADYGISMQLFGVLVGELCRDPKDITKLFRYTDMKDMNNYKLIPIKQAPKFVSPFTAITSENWDDSVVNAVMNKNTKYSPLEKILMT